MRNVYNNLDHYRQNATDNLGPIFHRTPFSKFVIDEFEYDREYQNAILASIQEFENVSSKNNR